ncbi:hypothetical protein BpHYR1_039192 [Brachionus plicatilis]|uniref:Uncharacterized protein n=1 Tax=Brachionus plicatilis TaxID=10195 RepID=A0A3M7T628_BRAPC|nr:hypothetical protein BpHYR1_039192 [Brachionus plicatilis]
MDIRGLNFGIGQQEMEHEQLELQEHLLKDIFFNFDFDQVNRTEIHLKFVCFYELIHHRLFKLIKFGSLWIVRGMGLSLMENYLSSFLANIFYLLITSIKMNLKELSIYSIKLVEFKRSI